MENQHPTSVDSDNDEVETSSKKRRGNEFLSYYQRLLGRRRSFEDLLNPSEAEESDETDTKPKKWRRFFKGLFSNVVPPPASTIDQTTENHGFNPDAWYGWQQPATEAAEDSSLDILSSTDTLSSSDQPGGVLEATEALPMTTPDIESSNVVLDATETEVDLEPRQAPIPTEQELIHNLPTARTFEQNQAPSATEREVVIERSVGGGLPLVLVAAEHIGRKRADKRIQKEIQHTAAITEQKLEAQNTAHNELAKLIQQNKEQLESLKRERGVNTVSETPQLAKAETSSPVSSAERFTPPEPEEQVDSRRVLESVADAAEHNVPVERVFERSHEVKDEPTVSPGAGSAASVGAVIAAQLAAKQPTPQQSRTAVVSSDQGLPVINDTMSPDMYKQAMRSGFIGAVMLIILGLIAYLVVK